MPAPTSFHEAEKTRSANLWRTVVLLIRVLALFEAAAHTRIKPVKAFIIPLWHARKLDIIPKQLA